jgi:hypothetical protein
MSYALNSKLTSKRITLSTHGGSYTGSVHAPVFTLPSAYKEDDRVVTVVSLESIYFKHPTFFSSKYLQGDVKLTGVTESTTIKPNNYSLFETDLYPTILTTNQTYWQALLTLDRIMYHLLNLIRDFIAEYEFLLKFEFVDEQDTQFIYNDPSNPMLLDGYFGGGKVDEDPNVQKEIEDHVATLERLYNARKCRCKLVFDSMSKDITLSGAFVRMLGLDPNKEHVINKSGLEVQLPMEGLQYFALTSNLVVGQMSSLFNSKVSNSDLFQLIHTNNTIPGEMISFFNTSNAGKVELGTSSLDYVQFRFFDEFEYPLLSLEDFIATVVIDQYIPAPLPEADRFRLDYARKGNAEDMRQQIRKKLRSGNF